MFGRLLHDTGISNVFLIEIMLFFLHLLYHNKYTDKRMFSHCLCTVTTCGVKMEKEKMVADSQVEVGQVMLPVDTNPAGNVHGGTIMKLVDNAAAVVASRHCRKNVVTASIDRMDFHNPVYLGDLVTLKASLNRVGRTSMVVGVRVESENLTTGRKTHTASAYLTFVALDEEGKPFPVPQLIVDSPDEEKHF